MSEAESLMKSRKSSHKYHTLYASRFPSYIETLIVITP
jgi:hypothetical protein